MLRPEIAPTLHCKLPVISTRVSRRIAMEITCVATSWCDSSGGRVRRADPTRSRVPFGVSITRAAAQLVMSHAALSEWVARRTLPE